MDTLILPAMILKIVSVLDLSARAEWASHIGCLASLRSPDRQIVEGDNFQIKCSMILCVYM